MSLPQPRGFIVVLLTLALVLGALLGLQRQKHAELRTEITLLRDEQREGEKLRAEHRRLLAAQVSPQELAALRADRVIVLQLRDEIDRLRETLRARERSLLADANAAAQPVYAIVLTVAMNTDGTLSLDGAPADATALRRQLADLPRGVSFRLNLPSRAPNGVPFERLTKEIETVRKVAMDIAKEQGLNWGFYTVPDTPP